MKLIKLFLFLILAMAAVSDIQAAGMLGKRPKEINPDYSKSVWDILMEKQSYNDIRTGMYLMAASQYDAAVTSYAKAVVKNPKDPVPHIFLGMALYWSGKVDEAMAQYRAALKLDKKSAEAHQLLGIAYGWKGDIKNAQKEFETADKLMRRADIKMNLSSVYAAQNRLDDALDYARQAVALAPQDPLYHQQLGELSEGMGRDYQAEESFKKAIKLFPYYEDAMLALGATYEKQENNADALKYYKKAVKVKPGDFVARLRYANLLSETGDKKEAAEVIKKAFAITSSDGKGLALNLAYSAQKNAQNNLNEQLQNLQNSLARFSAGDSIEVQAQVNFTPKTELKHTGEMTQLQQEFDAACKQAQDNAAKAFKRSFILNSGTEEQRAAQIQTIISALEQALENAPEGQQTKIDIKTEVLPSSATAMAQAANSTQSTAYNPRTVGNDMGLWVTGRSWIRFVEEAVYDIESRVYDNPANSFDHILLGLAYLTAGKGAAALKAFEKASELGADKELALMGRGTANIVLGNEAAAKEIYAQVLELNPKNKTAKNNLAFLNKRD